MTLTRARRPTGIRASAVHLRLSDVLRSGNREREAGVQADPLAGTSATDEPRLGELSEFGREVVGQRTCATRCRPLQSATDSPGLGSVPL
jgi:hypothetical protein